MIALAVDLALSAFGKPRRGAMAAMRHDRALRLATFEKIEGRLSLGETLGQALQILWRAETAGGTRHGSVLARALRSWAMAAMRGESLAEALSGWVAPAEKMLIASGEESGQLIQVLRHIGAMNL